MHDITGSIQRCLNEIQDHSAPPAEKLRTWIYAIHMMNLLSVCTESHNFISSSSSIKWQVINFQGRSIKVHFGWSDLKFAQKIKLRLNLADILGNCIPYSKIGPSGVPLGCFAKNSDLSCFFKFKFFGTNLIFNTLI